MSQIRNPIINVGNISDLPAFDKDRLVIDTLCTKICTKVILEQVESYLQQSNLFLKENKNPKSKVLLYISCYIFSSFIALSYHLPFPISFPWFNTPRYWSEHILELKEVLSGLQEPALVLPQYR